MSPISNKRLIFLLMNERDECYYVEGGIVKQSALPRWSKFNPDGWKDMSIQFATNQSYFATLRSFTTALKFVQDGEQILAERMLLGKGQEEVMFLAILKSNPAKGLNYYELEYKERIDFSKFNGDPRTGVAVNTLQYDAFALVQAKESTIYSIACNSSNPLAIKVLFDGILLQDKLNYQVINSQIINNTGHIWWTIPMTFLNNEGDSVGTIFGSQNFDNFDNPVAYSRLPNQANNFLVFDKPTTVTLAGSFSFMWSALHYTGGGFAALFFTSLDSAPDRNKVVWQNIGPTLGTPHPPFVVGQTYTAAINLTITLQANEKLFFMATIADAQINSMTITPFSTKISAVFATEQVNTVAYALRPIDVLQSLVQQITLGRYTADSNFLRRNNRKCVLSGSSLRSFPDAQVQTCFADFFHSYDVPYNMGLVVRNGVLWMEPVADLYNTDNQILKISNISNPILTVAEEFIYASAKVGYLKQNYNQRNGRYEFNCTHNYTFPITTVLNSMNLVSPYRADPFGMEFIRQNYSDLTTTDDKGDHDVFVVMVSDQTGQAEGVIDNTVPASIVTLILAAPIIRSPYSNTLVYSQYPTIYGIAQPGKLITIYADGFVDGTTNSDANGNWSYQIQTALRPVSLIFNGQHTITANAQTDPADISDFSQAVVLTVNPSLTAPFVITSPTPGDTLYNSLPLITGTAPQGSVVRVLLDGVQIGIVVTNSSGIWSFQTTAAISNGNRTISATSAGLTDATPISLVMNSAVTTPLITSIIYNDTLFTNNPTIQGVAIPGTTVQIFIDGGGGPIISGVASPVGTVVADASGRWQYTITGMTDPASGLVIDYIPDGLHTFGTTALPVNVQAAISGLRLMRGTNKGPVQDYESIWLDDSYIPPGQDPSTLPPTMGKFLHPETLYNIEETSPYYCLRAHDNILNSFLSQQVPGNILFNGAEVNPNLSRKAGGIVISEAANVAIPNLGKRLYWPYFLSFKAIIPKTFNEIMTELVGGGLITVEINGLEIDCLPIGTMSRQPATDAAQSWKLLVAGTTALATLVQLFKKGTTISVGKNMVYLSNLNGLHFVKYGFTPAPGYHFKDIYDDWQKNRQANYKAYKKDYLQPWETNDSTTLQAITNGVGVLAIDVVSITTGLVVATMDFTPVSGSPIQMPSQMQQLPIDFSAYPVGQYWFALKADGVYIGICEGINLAADWPNTLKLEYGGSTDRLDFWFSGGIAPMIRVQAKIYPWTPDSDVDLFEDEAGDWEITRGLAQKARVLQFGTEDHLIPDWMSMKLNEITLLDNLLVESIHYTRNKDSKWDPQDLGQGIPDVMIKIAVVPAENQTGITFETAGDTSPLTTPFVLDGTAFGFDPGVSIVVAQNQ